MAELLLCLMLLAVGGLVWNLRDNANPVVLWAWGWIIIVVVAAFMRFAGEVTWVHVSAQLISPLLPAFLLAGARAYTDRPTLNWILPAGLGFGVLRWVVGSFFPDLGHIMSAGAEPAVELVAAFLVMETARDRDAKPSQKILPLAFVAIAILDGATSLAYFWKDAFPTSMTLAWPLVGVTALGLQVTAGGHYIRRRRTALEHESRLARQALRESEQRFGVLAEQAGDLIFEIDSDWNLTYMTDSVAAVLDFRPEDMVGHSAANWIHVDDQERVLEALGAAMNNREQVTARARTRRQDGSWLWLEANLHGFVSDDGDTRIVGVARDVTETHEQQESLQRAHDTLEQRVEDRTDQLLAVVRDLEREVVARRLAEEELRASREHYRAVSELSSDFSFGFQIAPSGSFELEWVTEAFTRITGHSRRDIEETGLSALGDPEHVRTALAAIDSALVGGREEFDGRILTKGDEVRWIHTCLIAERSDEDGVVRVVGASSDVTERKLAEEERHRLEAHLGEVQRLESLGVLAGGIAHDFNNLLSVILGNSSLGLTEADENSDLARRFARIRSAAQHAAGLTEQMLTYSGMTPFSLKPTDLSSVARNTLELLEASVAKANVLELELANNLPLIEGDDTQLRQIIVNLVMNATEALGSGPGKIFLRTGHTEIRENLLPIGTPKAASGEYVFLEVEDSGAGIDAATRDRIFEPFFTTRRAGRGLGLAAVLGIVQGHRGFITVDSEPGEGTTFRVLFPQTESQETAPEPGSERRVGHGVQATVLIVDDEESVLEIGAEFLKRAGFDVITAPGGREALGILEDRGEEIEAVVLDLVMPEMDGEQTFREIRRLRPEMPVIVTSGYSEERTAERFSGDRIEGFLRKPYEPDELTEKVEAALTA
ncbi:MAG: PAS domain-containing protein [Myxococcota bacterium]|nr:PAS domain-containing protein [Myxococcota bacterium]